ncbi:DUF6114 domain-containing protein [Geobacillus icigianus]|uniref:Uncharacterized protein n=1 Tax=Geobacillus subterraneus TaxID=129338 RepID=A0A679FR75_9BACL|nr:MULTISPECIES: DUF6114 domain-containing protein [Geobacillus]KYD26788.1 hypothetical protein B4113_0664 [Geobacillus sp. B4113_201601]BBW95264.1 hypothetical protein GsuE55_00970 [Geobacillus subterraneus]
MMRKLVEIGQMTTIGALTGAFIGGIVVGGGGNGALLGGLLLAVALSLPIPFFSNRPTAIVRVKYGAAALLPGMLVGGSQWVSLGTVGAAAGGIASSVLAAFFAQDIIEKQERQGRYIRTRFHYVWLFFGGSLATFCALNAFFAAERAVPWQTWVRSIPMVVQTTVILAFVLLGVVIGVAWKKRNAETWRQAWTSARRPVRGVVVGGIVAIIVASLVHYGFLSVRTAARFVGPLLSYAFGWILPCAVGYLLAVNRHRPVLGSVLAMIGAGFVLMVGISVFPMLLLPGSGLMWAGLVTGLVMVVLAILSIIKPQSHVVFGSFLILASILSFVGAAGGLIIGGVIGLVGGALVVAWNGQQAGETDSDYPPPVSPLSNRSSTMTG